jgi:hypothetical protein
LTIFRAIQSKQTNSIDELELLLDTEDYKDSSPRGRTRRAELRGWMNRGGTLQELERDKLHLSNLKKVIELKEREIQNKQVLIAHSLLSKFLFDYGEKRLREDVADSGKKRQRLVVSPRPDHVADDSFDAESVSSNQNDGNTDYV